MLEWLTFKLEFHCFDTIIAMICVGKNNHFPCVITPCFVSNATKWRWFLIVGSMILFVVKLASAKLSLHICHNLQYVHGTCIRTVLLGTVPQYSIARCKFMSTYLLLSQVCSSSKPEYLKCILVTTSPLNLKLLHLHSCRSSIVRVWKQWGLSNRNHPFDTVRITH